MSSSSLGTLRSPCGPPLRRRRPRRRRRFRPRPRAPPFWPLLESRSADGPPASPPALGESDEDASEVVASTFGAWFCSASGDSGTSLPKVHGLGRRASKAHLHPSGDDSRNRLAPFLGASSQRADGPRRRRRQRCVSRDDRNVGRNTRRIKVAVDEAPSARRVPGPPSVPLERSASPDDPPVEAPDQPSGRCPLGRKGCPRDGTAPHVACPAPQRLFLYALPAVTRSRELRHGLCNRWGSEPHEGGHRAQSSTISTDSRDPALSRGIGSPGPGLGFLHPCRGPALHRRFLRCGRPHPRPCVGVLRLLLRVRQSALLGLRDVFQLRRLLIPHALLGKLLRRLLVCVRPLLRDGVLPPRVRVGLRVLGTTVEPQSVAADSLHLRCRSVL